MNLGIIFLTGLTSGGVSCAALQGGMLASFIANQKSQNPNFRPLASIAAFLASKLLIYSLSGFILGLIGSAFQLNLTTILFFQTVAALYVIATALNLLNVHPMFRYVVFQPPKIVGKWLRNVTQSDSWIGAAFLGLLTVLIPCGVTQAIQVNAIASGNPVTGFLSMFTFTLGTLPLFVAIGLLTGAVSAVWQQRMYAAAAILLIFLGVSSLNGVLTVLNSPFSVQGFKSALATINQYEQGLVAGATTNQNLPKIEDGVQKVSITITPAGYSPKTLTVKKGIPVELTLTSKENYTCANFFILKAFNISARLQPSETRVFRFIPDRVGQFTFSCSMGMYAGVVEVI